MCPHNRPCYGRSVASTGYVRCVCVCVCVRVYVPVSEDHGPQNPGIQTDLSQACALHMWQRLTDKVADH